MLQEHWLVLGGVCCPAALRYSLVRPYGQRETLALSLFRAFQLCTAQLPNEERACWPYRCQLDLGSAHSLVCGAQQKKYFALQGVLRKQCLVPRYIPLSCTMLCVCLPLDPTLCVPSHLPRSACSSQMWVVRSEDAFWHSEIGREESWDLRCFRCGRPPPLGFL